MNDRLPTATSHSNGNQPAHSVTDQPVDDLLTTQKLLRATLDSSTDMIQVFEAVRNQQGEIIDFTWILNNHTSEKIYGDVVGKSLLQLQPGVVEEGIFAAFKQVVESGLPQQYEKHYVHEQFDGWFHQSVVKINDGVATTTADITPRKKAEQQVLQSRDMLQALMDAPNMGVSTYSAIRNPTGEITDFRCDYVNKRTREAFQGHNPTGMRVSEFGPDGLDQLPFLKQAIETGQKNVYTRRAESGISQGWFLFSNAPLSQDRLIQVWEDITELKQAEAQILRLKEEVAQKATDKYRSLFESIDEGFCLLEVLFDAQERPFDYRFLEVNPAFERQTGWRDATGKTMRELEPNREPQWLERSGRIVKTGIAERYEVNLEAMSRVFDMYGFPFGESGANRAGLVFSDVTERKRREADLAFLADLMKDFAQLATAEEIMILAGKRLTEHLHLSRYMFVGIYPEAGTCTYLLPSHPAGQREISGSFILADYHTQAEHQLLSSGHSMVVNDVRDGTRSLDQIAAFAAFDIASIVNTPYLSNGRWVFDLGVARSQPSVWREDEIELLREISARLWIRIERARAEEALRTSQKRFESIANLVPDLLWDSDPDGATNWYNQQWPAYTGQRLEEAIGWGWTDAIHPDDRDASARRYGEAVAAGTLLRQEHRIRRYDGVYRWFVVTATPLKDQAGQVVKMYGAATDIDDLKRLQATLLEADRRKDEYLAMLAHELRNPLTPVRNGLQLLTQMPTQDQLLGTLLPIMNRQMDHIMRLMDDLLDVSRISRGKIELHTGRMDLTQVVAQTLDAMRPLYTQAGRQLTAELPDYPLYLDGDATRLHQVVTNLLTNGLRYTHQAGRVWLSLEQVGGQAILRVADNGIGLAADQLEAIFELFVQVDHSLARSQGGLGLGLSLVQQLVQLHGGRVEAHSQGLDQGSEFVVSLPLLIPSSSL